MIWKIQILPFLSPSHSSIKKQKHVIFITEKPQENGASGLDDENSQQNDPTAERKFFFQKILSSSPQGF